MSRSIALLVLSLAAPGCRCGPPPTGAVKPEFDPDPRALSFEACPTRDEDGKPVADVFPDEQKLTLRNLGKASGAVQISFTGPGKDSFSLHPEKKPPAELGPTAETEVVVRFSPAARGEVKAEMAVDDGNLATDPVSVPLLGNGRNLPSQPTAEVAVETGGGFEKCFTGGTCLLSFRDTFYKEAAILRLKLSNLGCPTLKVKGLEVVPLGGGAGNLAYYLDEPGVPPSPAAPLALTTADGNAETSLKIRFAPENDNSGVTQRYGLLRILTNDPNLNTADSDPDNDGVYEVTLTGNAAEPAVYATPTFCDFTNPSDLCGNSTKQADRARFEVKNGGNTEIVIDQVKLQNGGSGGRFQITSNPQGQTIPQGGSKLLEVTHTDAPLYVTELVTITASANGQPAGSAILTLAGGKKPCLSTNPAEQLDFQNPSAEISTKTVDILNGASCGELVVNQVSVDSQPFFSVVAPLIPAGTRVPAGTAVTATIQYKRPVSGGQQSSMLAIDTNDPDFASPSFKKLRLYSESPLDQLPVAVLKGCLPSEANCSQNGSTLSMSVKLSALSPKELIMHGADSYDPGNTSATPISNYLFRLVTKPGNASGAKLENDGLKTASSSARLTLDNLATGLYRVTLTVYDDRSQQSAIAAELKISVNQ